MTRLVEIALFLTPFIGFAVWRLVAPTERLRGWFVTGFAALLVLLLLVLLVLRQLDATDGGQTYVPAHMQGGQVVPGHAAPP